METDVVVIGAGPAGLAAAAKAAEQNVKVLVLEREKEPGGILLQCIHQGFGNTVFGKTFTGPEYAQRFIDLIDKQNIQIKTGTMVLRIQKDKKIIAVNEKEGMIMVQAKAVVLAMGCRERTRNQILLPGSRPAGIFTAGSAQQLINLKGVMPGKRVVVLGSGDVGLIMARRFLLEGACVEGVYEILPSPSGLTRNVVQCLEDYDIPLYLSHTVTNVHGNHRLTGVSVAKINPETLEPDKKTERFVNCDTLLLAVGLIPENELSKQIDLDLDEKTDGPVVDNTMQTSQEGFFACGNVVQVYDVVDDVTVTSEIAGLYAARCALNGSITEEKIRMIAGKNVSSVVPQIVRENTIEEIVLYVRVTEEKTQVIFSIDTENKCLLKDHRKMVKPPEMVKITLSAKDMAVDKPHSLWVNMEEKK